MSDARLREALEALDAIKRNLPLCFTAPIAATAFIAGRVAFLRAALAEAPGEGLGAREEVEAARKVVDICWQEIVQSGNARARDFGWPAARSAVEQFRALARPASPEPEAPRPRLAELPAEYPAPDPDLLALADDPAPSPAGEAPAECRDCGHSHYTDVMCDEARAMCQDPECQAEAGRAPSDAKGGRVAMIHDLKTWPGPFTAIAMGEKRHEIRKADRPFAVGDVLHLREWDPSTGTYTGRGMHKAVTYLTPGGQWGLPDGLCVMSLGPASPSEHGPSDAKEGGTP